MQIKDTHVTPHPAASWMGRIKCTRLLNGHYVTTLYLFIKLCYTANIMLQFILLNAALKSDEYLLFGFQVTIFIKRRYL